MAADEYAVEAQSDATVMRGVLRLESPEAYDRLLRPVEEALRTAAAAGKPYVLDVADLALMNSSGIRALAGLLLEAKRSSAKVVLRARAAVPWQAKTAASLHALYTGLAVELR